MDEKASTCRARTAPVLQNCLGQELERSLGAAALRTDFRVATCQLNALDHSSKEATNRILWWKVLGCVPWVADGSNARGCVEGSLGRRSSRILDFEVVYGTSLGRAAAWPKMLVSVDLRLLVLTRSDMYVARRASWFVPVLRSSERHGEETARRPTLLQDRVRSFFFSCRRAVLLVEPQWAHGVWCRSLLAGLSCDDSAWRSCAEAHLRAAEATRVQPRT